MVFETHVGLTATQSAAIEQTHEMLINQYGLDTEEFEVVPKGDYFEVNSLENKEITPNYGTL